MVGISQDEVGAGTFPDIPLPRAGKCLMHMAVPMLVTLVFRLVAYQALASWEEGLGASLGSSDWTPRERSKRGESVKDS